MATNSGISAEVHLRRLDERHKAERQAVVEKQQAERKAIEEALTTPDFSTSSANFFPSLPLATLVSNKRRKRSKPESEVQWPVIPAEPDRRTLISLLTGEESESEEESELYVQKSLPTRKFDFEDLREHFKTYTWTKDGEILLQDIVVNNKLTQPGIFHQYSPEDEKWHHSHYTVFDVGPDGAPLPMRREACSEDRVDDDVETWNILKSVNVDSTRRPVVGRISLIREPSPVILGALHLTMKHNFDMDEIFKYLREKENSAAHIHHRTFDANHLVQRSIVFKFDYFTVVGEGLKPMPWQETDRIKERPDTHIPISRCTSIVALSLSGEPVCKLRNVARRGKAEEGFIYDPWAPWHVLNIQCYPDHEHTMDSHDSAKHYVNGPEAFLQTLLAEFKDAEKRFKIVLKDITKLVVPPSHIMFDSELRDKLLFEDDAFTYSRRYFWAYHTLGLMSSGIKAIINEYKHTFTDDVWLGKHKTLWPLIEENNTHRNEYWRRRLAHLKQEFDIEITKLDDLLLLNEETRDEINAFENQLFQGTSVLESRKSVELAAVTILQGHNIKLLTLVSIFFLPLTFVTSIFGMSNMPDDHWSKTFGITIATVCVPFFLLIGFLNTTSGMEIFREKWHKLVPWARRDRVVGNKPELDTIGPGNPRVRRRSHSILETARAIQIRKTQPSEDGLFQNSIDIRNEFSIMPHYRLDRERLSADFMAPERRSSRGSDSRPSNNIELKSRMPSLTPASTQERTIETVSESDSLPRFWGKKGRKKSDASHGENV